MLLVRWALFLVCLYFVAASEASGAWLQSGWLIVLTLAGSNILLGRLESQAFEQIGLMIGIAVLDASLVLGAWYVSGLESFAPVILSLCLLNLALVDAGLGEIAAVAVAALISYFAVN